MPESTPSSHFAGNNPYLKRVYTLASVDETRALYDEWAAGYDSDLMDEEYVAPKLAADMVSTCLGSSGHIGETVEILDAGCGTGLVGACLSKLGAKRIDGLDLSPGMLNMAKKTDLYRMLEIADLSKPIDRRDAQYDVVVCVGTLTRAHVGPAVLAEFVRVVKKGGFVVATVLDDIWEDGGYRTEVYRLKEDGKAKILGTDLVGYRQSSKVGGRMVVLEKL